MIRNFLMAASAAALMVGCAPGGGSSGPGLDLGFSDNRPEGRRYLDYLLSDGGLEEIQTDLAARSVAAASGQGLSFLGGRNLQPYDAPILGKTRARRELNRLADCMIEAWGGPKPTVDVIISSGLAPAGQALPNQVSMNIGLIAGDDITAGEIAFVLAHELSHVFLDHYGREEARRMQAEVADKMAQAALIGVVMSEMRGRRGAGGNFEFFVEDDGAVSENTAYVMAAYAASQVVADGVVESSWARAQEFESDRLALDILARAGLSEEFGYQAIRRIAKWQEGQKGRLDKMEAFANQKMQEAVESGDANMVISTGIDVFSKAVVSAALDVYEFFDRTHPSPEAREAELDDYLEEFEDVDEPTATSSCDTTRLERALRSNSISSAKRSLEYATEVDDLLAAGDIAGARRAFNRSTQGGLGRHPVPLLAGFRVETAAKRPRQALGHLERIRRGPDTPLAVHTTLVAEYISRQRYRNALQAISVGEKYFLPDFFLPNRLQIATAQGDAAEVALIVARCEASPVSSIKSACGEVAQARKRLFGAGETSGAEGENKTTFDGILQSLDPFSDS